MKLIIDISEQAYELLQRKQDLNIAESIIANGTPLPKGHGRLIDADTLRQQWVFGKAEKEEIDNAPTIIEADKEETT